MATTRADGRVANQLRPLAAIPGALSRADGSSRFSHDRTEVLVSVYGPCEAKRAREVVGAATLEVLVRPRSGLPGPSERECEQLVTSTLGHLVLTALHPRTAVSVVVQAVSDDGSFLSAALNGVGVALVHAGVPMRGMLAACTIALLPSGEALLDPTLDEQREAVAVLTFAHLLRRRRPRREDGAVEAEVEAEPAELEVETQLLLSHAQGTVSQTHYELCLRAAEQAAQCVDAFCRSALTPQLA